MECPVNIYDDELAGGVVQVFCVLTDILYTRFRKQAPKNREGQPRPVVPACNPRNQVSEAGGGQVPATCEPLSKIVQGWDAARW